MRLLSPDVDFGAGRERVFVLLADFGLATIFRRSNHPFGFGSLLFFLKGLLFFGGSLGFFGVGGFHCGDFFGRREDAVFRGAFERVALRVGDVLGKSGGFLVGQFGCGCMRGFDFMGDFLSPVKRSVRSVAGLDWAFLFFRLFAGRLDFFNDFGRGGNCFGDWCGCRFHVLPLRNRFARKRLEAGRGGTIFGTRGARRFGDRLGETRSRRLWKRSSWFWRYYWECDWSFRRGNVFLDGNRRSSRGRLLFVFRERLAGKNDRNVVRWESGLG